MMPQRGLRQQWLQARWPVNALPGRNSGWAGHPLGCCLSYSAKIRRHTRAERNAKNFGGWFRLRLGKSTFWGNWIEIKARQTTNEYFAESQLDNKAKRTERNGKERIDGSAHTLAGSGRWRWKCKIFSINLTPRSFISISWIRIFDRLSAACHRRSRRRHRRRWRGGRARQLTFMLIARPKSPTSSTRTDGPPCDPPSPFSAFI